MASYDINKVNLSLLKQYKASFDNENSYYNRSYNLFLSCYLNNCSDPFIQNMSTILKRDYEQIKKGYNSISSWWNSYNSGVEALENSLAHEEGNYLNDSNIRSFINSNLPNLDDYEIDYNDISDIEFTPDNIRFINDELTDTINIVYEYLKVIDPQQATELMNMYQDAVNNYGYVISNSLSSKFNSILQVLANKGEMEVAAKTINYCDFEKIEIDTDSLIKNLIIEKKSDNALKLLTILEKEDVFIIIDYEGILKVVSNATDVETLNKIRNSFNNYSLYQIRKFSDEDAYNFFIEVLEYSMKKGNLEAEFIFNNLYVLNTSYNHLMKRINEPFKIISASNVGGGKFIWYNNSITFGKGAIKTKDYLVALHELGHALFFIAFTNKYPDNYLSVFERGKERVVTLTEDGYIATENLYYFIDKVKSERELSLLEAKKKFEFSDTLNEVIEDYGMADLSEIKSILEKLVVDNKEIDRILKLSHEDVLKETAQVIYQKKIMSYTANAMTIRPETIAINMAGDAINALVEGEDVFDDNHDYLPLPHAHGPSYYAKDDIINPFTSNLQFEEQFANFTALKLNNSTDVLDALKKTIGDEWYDFMDQTFNSVFTELKGR